MDESKINQTNKNFAQYLDDELLVKSKFEEVVFNTYIKNSLESLKVAINLYENNISYLWTIVSSYYAMFYIASAFIYVRGYKSQHQIVHKIINDSLIVLAKDKLEKHYFKEYEEEKNKALSASESLLDSYEYERIKRSRFQYETTEDIKRSKALTSLNRAKKFVLVLRKLINKIKKS